MKESEAKEGIKVWTTDLDFSRINGTLHKNIEHPEVSKWYVKYEDGQEFAVLDFNYLYKQ